MIVLLAAVGAFAVGLAGTGAYVAVSRYLQDQNNTAGPDQLGETGTATPTTTPATPVEPCPEFTIDRVQAEGRPGNLVTELYVRGTKANGDEGEAWICRDSDDRLYYQGHDIDGQPFAEGENAIVVGGGINGDVTQDGSAYVATTSFGQYRVSPTEFRLVGNNGVETVWIMS
jgi:hypothetical protein